MAIAEIGDLGLDLLARQHLEPAYQDGELDDGRLGAVEAGEGRMRLLLHHAAEMARPHAVIGDAFDASTEWASAAASRGTGYPSTATVGQSLRPVRQPAKMRTSSV